MLPRVGESWLVPPEEVAVWQCVNCEEKLHDYEVTHVGGDDYCGYCGVIHAIIKMVHLPSATKPQLEELQYALKNYMEEVAQEMARRGK